MLKPMSFRQWLLKLLGIGPPDQALRLVRQQARDSLMCEIEQIVKAAKTDEHGRPH